MNCSVATFLWVFSSIGWFYVYQSSPWNTYPATLVPFICSQYFFIKVQRKRVCSWSDEGPQTSIIYLYHIHVIYSYHIHVMTEMILVRVSHFWFDSRQKIRWGGWDRRQHQIQHQSKWNHDIIIYYFS